MSHLSIHPASDAHRQILASSDRATIAAELQRRGIRYEHPGVPAAASRASGADAMQVCAELVARETARHGYTTVDVVRVTPETPNLPALRGKFLSEHTHAEDEARYLLDGSACFYLRWEDQVLIVELTAGDLISVPSGTRHWFDMGARPAFTAIRFFTRADGWVGEFTGDTIADRFPLYAGRN